MTKTIRFEQWFASLPALVVWAVGMVLAAKRWRERPQISRWVAISCAIGLLTGILMPVAWLIGNKINGMVFNPLLRLVRAGLEALSIGLLLMAAFLTSGQTVLAATEESDKLARIEPSTPHIKDIRLMKFFSQALVWLFLFLGLSVPAAQSPAQPATTNTKI